MSENQYPRIEIPEEINRLEHNIASPIINRRSPDFSRD